MRTWHKERPADTLSDAILCWHPPPVRSLFIISLSPVGVELNFKSSLNESRGQGMSNEIPRHWLFQKLLPRLRRERKDP